MLTAGNGHSKVAWSKVVGKSRLDISSRGTRSVASLGLLQPFPYDFSPRFVLFFLVTPRAPRIQNLMDTNLFTMPSPSTKGYSVPPLARSNNNSNDDVSSSLFAALLQPIARHSVPSINLEEILCEAMRIAEDTNRILREAGQLDDDSSEPRSIARDDGRHRQ